ncbi:MAG: hypothetical protein ACR2RV_07780, partial [Verrucomicrobiales bacterium]
AAVPAPSVDPGPHQSSRSGLVALVVLSLFFGLSVIGFRAGLDATPYETTDSAGRQMGFNDTFSKEHYGLILGNCSILRTLGYMGLYDWLFVGCHGLGIIALLRGRDELRVSVFFLVQPIIFPWGIPGLLVLFFTLWGVFSGTGGHDREAFVDIPYVPLMAHSFWLLVCAVVSWCLMRSRRKTRELDPKD